MSKSRDDESWKEYNVLYSGEPTVCEKNSASVNMANCLLEDQAIDYSVLHLNDPVCKGEMDNVTHMVTFIFNNTNCGAVVMVGTHFTKLNEWIKCWFNMTV